MKLNNKIITELRSNYTLRSKIGLLTEKHPATIVQWCEKNANNGPLTNWAVLVFLAQEFNLKINEIIVDDIPVIPKNITR